MADRDGLKTKIKDNTEAARQVLLQRAADYDALSDKGKVIVDNLKTFKRVSSKEASEAVARMFTADIEEEVSEELLNRDPPGASLVAIVPTLAIGTHDYAISNAVCCVEPSTEKENTWRLYPNIKATLGYYWTITEENSRLCTSEEIDAFVDGLFDDQVDYLNELA